MIVSSVIALNNLQVDGRRVIEELHTDDQGNQYTFDYMADPDTDINAVLAQRADDLNAQLAAQAQSQAS